MTYKKQSGEVGEILTSPLKFFLCPIKLTIEKYFNYLAFYHAKVLTN